VTDPLRILHVIARLNVGGAALSTVELAEQQLQAGHDVLLVAGSLAEGEESMEYEAEERSVPLLRLPVLHRELSPRRDARAVRTLRRLLCDRRPDVLHTHTAKAGATGRLAALLAGDARPRAVVHTFHGHVLSGYFSPRRERAFRLVERLLAYGTSTLIAVSDEVRDDLVSYGVASRERFAVIPYGFDFSTLDGDAPRRRERLRRRLGLADETFVLGWVGRLAPIKRPADLVRTLHALRGRGVDAALVAVGDGPERDDVEALAAELGVEERCHLVGYQRGMCDWYAVFDALVLTSANEGTPVAAIEALASGRPVVATDAGGTRTVVEHGRSGFLAPVGATDELAARLAELARDPSLAARFAGHGAAAVRTRFSLERTAADVEALYRQALAT
jgi:glycosyltransferase involved in cell wall biosynthesis